jgi:hypothetical protein
VATEIDLLVGGAIPREMHDDLVRTRRQRQPLRRLSKSSTMPA